MANTALGQKLRDIKKDYDDSNLFSAQPLTRGAFSRFISNHFSYTILGSPSPTTGFKVETEKPSIALKGRIAANKNATFITTLELQAGADGQIFQVFSNDKLSSQFKSTIGFNRLLTKNYANYEYFASKAENKYVTAGYRKMAIDKYNDLVKQDLRTSVMKNMLNQRFIDNPKFDTLLMLLGSEYIDSQEEIKDVVCKVLEEMKVAYSNIPLDNALSNYASLWKDSNGSRELKEEFFNKYKKEAKLQKRAVDSLHIYEMDNVSEFWTGKFIWWANASPFVSNTNFMHYQPLTQSLQDKSSVLWGAKLSLNLFWTYKVPNRYHYLTFGFTPQRMNSLDEMTKYAYKKTVSKPVIPNPDKPNEKETVAEEEPGTAYEGVYRSGAGIEYFIEGYSVPWTNGLAPGFYIRVNYSKTKHRLNREQLGAYLGILWNVKNSDKDSKNLLTIIPYAGWSNLLDQYTDEGKTSKKALHSLFTAGLRIGVPINIGK